MPPKKGSRLQSKAPEPEALYRVFRSVDDRLAYLPDPKSNGLPLEEAERLSNQLGIETYVKKVWEKPAG